MVKSAGGILFHRRRIRWCCIANCGFSSGAAKNHPTGSTKEHWQAVHGSVAKSRSHVAGGGVQGVHAGEWDQLRSNHTLQCRPIHDV